jgi:hypothetical protein
VKNKVIQSNFPGNFHDKISLRISLLQEELKNGEIFIYTGPSVLLKKLNFTGTGFKPTFLEISFIIQCESNNQIKILDH